MKTEGLPGDDLLDVQLVYCSPTTAWYTKNDRGTWIKASESRAAHLLREAGFSNRSEVEISPLQLELNQRMRSKDVDFAGYIAGWAQGVHETDGKRVLVTMAPTLPIARSVQWPRLRGFLDGLLGEEQCLRFLCWLHFRRKSLLTHQWLPGQAIVLMGPKGCGKSFLQHVVTQALGGRSAKPWRYMKGETQFNLDLIGAEHLSIEDDAPTRDIRTRRAVGNAIKTMLYGRCQSAHGKGLNAVTLEPRWAMTVSLNDEPENIAVIPPIDESLEDKITIFRCSYSPRPIDAGMREQEWLSMVLHAELAGMLHEVDTIVVPPEWGDARSGVAAFQHPDALAVLKSISPEAALLELINEHILEDIWDGSANDLEDALRTKAPDRLRTITTWHNAVGTYLGRLSKEHPHRFQHRKTARGNVWRILAPNHVEPSVEPVEPSFGGVFTPKPLDRRA